MFFCASELGIGQFNPFLAATTIRAKGLQAGEVAKRVS
jgi:hypothetical protein